MSEWISIDQLPRIFIEQLHRNTESEPCKICGKQTSNYISPDLYCIYHDYEDIYAEKISRWLISKLETTFICSKKCFLALILTNFSQEDCLYDNTKD